MLKLIIYIAATCLVTHDFHLSKADIHYRSDLQSLECTVHLFIDDLEKAINEDYGIDSLFLFTPKESITSDSIIGMYINDHLKIQIDGQIIRSHMIGKEMSEDLQGVYCYLEVEKLEEFDKIEVSNSIMLTTFNDQKNIINIKKDNKSKAFHILDHNSQSKKIDF